MGFRGYRHHQEKRQVRPAAVGMVAVAGVLACLALFAMEVALVWLRMQRGLPIMSQAVDLVIAGLVALLLIWIYWGVWDLLPSAWQVHVFLGIPLAAGFAYAAWNAPDLAGIIAHQIPTAERALAADAIRIGALAMAVIEIATFLVLLGSRSAFGIGRQKPLWERVNR